ncbi:MAG: uracil-DNA glycosylase [Patescibacteria group bacterium]|nr:uracil-DNA glycosylase [Patescibacteria group bacterium]
MTKQALLEELKGRLLSDKTLPFKKSNLVFGEGSVRAQIFFIGEAPGLKEDQEERPFVGRSGQLLTKNLLEIGIKREDVYISNIVKKRPPQNRDPDPIEIKKFEGYLKEQIEIIDPKIIVTLGRFAMNFFLPEAKISLSQGKVFKVNNRLIFPMFHPAAAMRSAKTMAEFKKSFKKLSILLRKQPLI